MTSRSKHVAAGTVLAAFLLCASGGAGAGSAERTPTVPTVLSRTELVGLVHCLRHSGKNAWFGARVEGGKRLRLRYKIIRPSATRSGFDVAVTVYSANENSGFLFYVNWDEKPCGVFTVLNEGDFTRKRGVWVWTAAPFGGLWRRRQDTKNLRAVMTQRRTVVIDADSRDKGCGTWSTAY